MLWPDGYTGAPAPLVIYHHGSGEDIASLETEPLKTATITLLRQHGYIVIASNEHGANWGNAISQQDVLDLWAWLEPQIPISRVVFLSQSMGGLVGLSVAAGSTPLVKGWAGVGPVCDLANLYGAWATDAIKTAYGIAADGSDYATKTAGHNPALRPGSDFAGLRMRFYASPDDTVVPKAANSDALAALVEGYATENVVVVASGEHGDPSQFQPADVLAFFDRCV